MLNRIVVFTCVFLSFLCISTVKAEASDVTVSAESAIVMNAQTGEILFAKNPYEKRGMASTTKIMTSLIAVESQKLQCTTKAKASDVLVEGTSIGLKPDDIVTLDVLVKGMLLESGNDAANVTASMLGPGKEKFVALMNKRAKELGMDSTCFKNPSGLTEEGHYSTAFDMANLASFAISNKTFREYCSAKKLSVSYGSPERSATFYNHNRFLNVYDGALGIKTGFTKASGRCLVTAVEKDGAMLVAVTLNARDDWNDHKKMYDYGFGRVKKVVVHFDCSAINVPVVGADVKYANVKLSSPLVFFAQDNFTGYKTAVYAPAFIYAGVSKNDYIGKVEIVNEKGRVIVSSYLYATENAAQKVKIEEEIPFYKKIINKFKEGLSKRQT